MVWRIFSYGQSGTSHASFRRCMLHMIGFTPWPSPDMHSQNAVKRLHRRSSLIWQGIRSAGSPRSIWLRSRASLWLQRSCSVNNAGSSPGTGPKSGTLGEKPTLIGVNCSSRLFKVDGNNHREPCRSLRAILKKLKPSLPGYDPCVIKMEREGGQNARTFLGCKLIWSNPG